MDAAQTPFHDVPKLRFLKSALLPSVLVYFAAYFVMGVVVQSGDPAAARLGTLEVARTYHMRLFEEYAAIPEVCKSGAQVSDFQAERCEQSWSKFRGRLGVGLIPPAAALAFLFVAFDLLLLTYRNGRKTLLKSSPVFTGKAGHPVDVAWDGYGWFFCLRAIHVELPGGKSVRAYLPKESHRIRSGDSIAVYDGGNRFGKKRYFARLHTPHVAVVRGG